MSYRLAWEHLRRIEEHTGLTVVQRKRGGAQGGRTVLTTEGQALLEAYLRCRQEVQRAAARACARHFARWTRTDRSARGQHPRVRKESDVPTEPP